MSRHEAPEILIDDLTRELVRGGGPLLHDLFAAEGAKAPHIQWAPKLSDISNPLILGFAKRCLALEPDQPSIPEPVFQLTDFTHLLPWMMVLEVEDDGTAFRYSHYGEGIAKVRGLSMLDRTSADFAGHIGTFFTAVYRAISQRKEWLLTEHAAPKQIFARTWERLIVPVTNAVGEVTRFAAMNVPDNDLRAGLEIIPDPVMVLDADQIVRYANGAARRMFDRGQFPEHDMTLFEYSGIDLDFGQTPTEMVRKPAVHNRKCLATRNNLLRDFLVTISASRIWDNDFYVITLRPDFAPG